MLLHLINPNLPAPPDPSGHIPDRCAERLDHFIDQMGKQGDRMLIPTPALAEVLVKAGNAGQEWLSAMHGRKAIRIAPFDEKAAVECAALSAARPRSRQSTRDKAKFDEQIVAIAVAEGAELMLSDDADVRALAPTSLTVRGIGDLDLPPEDPQAGLFDQNT